MRLSSTQIKHVAKLANLTLKVEEEKLYAEQLSQILDYIDLLNKADAQDIEPTFNITGLVNVMREDKTEKSLSREEALKNSAAVKNGMFITKGVFEEE